MRIDEVQDIRIDEDGNTYRQSTVDALTEAYNTNWDEVEGQTADEVIAEAEADMLRLFGKQ